MINGRFPVGKLPADFMQEVLGRFGPLSRRVLTGPEMGEDAAAVLTSLPCLVAAMDPVTAATDRLGWYVVHVNANDVATRGAEPLWFLFTLLMSPAHATRDNILRVFSQVEEACKEIGAQLIGGHTEVTPGIDRPIAIGTMLGEITTFRLTSTHGARPGDAVVLAGPAGVEGTAILARDHAAMLRARGIGEATVVAAAELLNRPGISILQAARIATRGFRPHAMHDPTEGGIATALHELAKAANVGLKIYGDQVPILPETRDISAALGVDPWGMLSSGALLLAMPEEDVEGYVRACMDANIAAARIGQCTAAEDGVQREDEDGGFAPFSGFARDEIVRVTAPAETECEGA
ncbi:MAG: hypothetical protein FJX76_00665 [Armatimonadetes bacterium]|nr:hypothetical protein [Armatimonadota bacterium]